VTADLDAAAAPVLQELAAGRLRPISSAPQTLPLNNPSAAGIRAFKFHDPEGHALELLQFPPEKGEARWHSSAAAGPLLGIDHSAIGVADSERSGRFYAELLGLRRAGDGLNQGLEQDHLDGLVGTRVRITSHRCPMGPGVECLEYQAPPGGRDRPADTTAADHLHGQIRLAVANLEAIANRVGQPPLALEPQAAAQLGFRRALPLHDPDGHALQVVEA
jgi:catechol 2,3-dioxygenase-like lactoylglutathione lyase family enzyme